MKNLIGVKEIKAKEKRIPPHIIKGIELIYNECQPPEPPEDTTNGNGGNNGKKRENSLL